MDTSNPAAVLKTVLPKVPLLLQTAAWHTLGMSKTSSKWDLRTELVVKFIRALVSSPAPTPIGKQQRMSIRDPGIKGPMWISKITIPTPGEDNVKTALVNAVDALKEGGEQYTLPEMVPVEAEWTGFRAGADGHRQRPDLSEQQHYERLMKEVTSDVTVLYFHGGALFLMDPASHRVPCSKIAKMTGGRVLSVRYRLAPKHAFPEALLDALIAYLALLSPTPGSFHEPVPANNIVFAGDSAGGNLSMALVQFILQLHRGVPTGSKPILRFHGVDVEVPLPAGVAPNSGWMDLTRCMPSIYENSQFDYLPPPPSIDEMKHFPEDDMWPADPPRGDLYCDTSMLCHPLVSPMAAKDWTGVCPVWLGYGTECLTDEGKVVARRIARQGGTVVWQEYEAMPHCFALIFEHLEGGKRCFRSWTTFMNDVVEGKAIETHGLFITAKKYHETRVDVTDLLHELSEADVDDRMSEAREKRRTGEDGETKVLPRL